MVIMPGGPRHALAEPDQEVGLGIAGRSRCFPSLWRLASGWARRRGSGLDHGRVHVLCRGASGGRLGGVLLRLAQLGDGGGENCEVRHQRGGQ
jgi:hypothetical protein